MQLIWNYFYKYYITFALPSMPITEAAFFVCLILLFHPMRPSLKNFGIGALHYLILFILIVVLKPWFQYFYWNMTYSYLVLSLAYILVFVRKNYINSLVRFCVFWSAYVFSSAFSKAFGNVVCGYLLGMSYTNNMGYVFIAVVSPLIMIGFTLMCKMFSLDKYEEKRINWRYSLIPIVICIVCNIAKILIDGIKEDGLPFFGFNELEASVFIFFIGVLIYLLNCIGYFVFYHHVQLESQVTQITDEIQVIKKGNAALDNSAVAFQENMEEIRKIRHDIKNQIAYLQIMMTSKDYVKMEEYFNEMNKIFSASLNMSDCENVIIRNILNLETYKARQSGIALESKILLPKEISVSDFDLTTVLLNLLDNAIEACIEDKCVDAVIKCNMLVKGNYLYLNIVNPVSSLAKKERRKILQTGKEDKNLHGLGTKIVSSIVEKYGGAVSFQVEDDYFSVDVMMALN